MRNKLNFELREPGNQVFVSLLINFICYETGHCSFDLIRKEENRQANGLS